MGTMSIMAIVINSKDNVATAISDIEERTRVEIKVGRKLRHVLVREFIPSGHKFATKRITKGEEVVKYGYRIGRASSDIDEGKHVHVHNVESERGRGDVTQ